MIDPNSPPDPHEGPQLVLTYEWDPPGIRGPILDAEFTIRRVLGLLVERRLNLSAAIEAIEAIVYGAYAQALWDGSKDGMFVGPDFGIYVVGPAGGEQPHVW